MTDVHDKITRSYIMSKIRSKDTKPEMVVRRYLYSKGFRYRLHDPKLPSTPDIVLSKYKTVIFINGCFWHGHKNCKFAMIPKTNSEWWKEKIKKTMKRDKTAIKLLKDQGWNTIIIWECEIKPKKRNKTLENILLKINKEME